MIQAVYIGTGIIHELVVTSSQHVLPPRRGLVTARSTLHHGRGSVLDLRLCSSQKQYVLDWVMRTSYQDLPQHEDDGSPW